jgi:hypothetical protein
MITICAHVASAVLASLWLDYEYVVHPKNKWGMVSFNLHT